jgi:outer membrane protein with beta-barrel domain
MKRLLTAILMLATTIAARAQTNSGDWMIGGNVRINTTESNNEFTLQPMAGYFFAKGFAAGAEFKISFSKFGAEKTTAFGIGPFARYYFNLNNSSFKPLLHSSFTVETQTTKENGIKNRNTVTSLFIAGGAAYFINENVAVEAVAGYNRSKYENVDSEGGFAFRLGFQVHLLGREVRTIKGY